MPPLRAVRQHPEFAPLFDEVYPFCWLILLWQLDRFFRQMRAQGISDGFYSVNRWGFVTLLLAGDRRDPFAYKPIARTFRPLTDASWGSDLPACLECGTLMAQRTLVRPCEAREVARKTPPGPIPAPPNTS